MRRTNETLVTKGRLAALTNKDEERFMNCPEVTERLPWLLNDTLPAAERAAVLLHLEECPECRLQLQDSAGVLEAMDNHPASERLVEYVFGAGMEIPERVSIGRHVASCARCSQEVDLLSQSHKQMPSQSIWKARYIGIAAILAITASLGMLLSRIWQESHQREAVLAAQVRSLEEQIDRMSRPSAVGLVVDLLPLDARQRTASTMPATAAAGAGTETTFLLNSRLPRTASGCAIRLSSESRELWAAPQVARGANGEFLVRVPAGFLQPGPHRLTVSCGAAIETYAFTVR